MLLKRKNIKHTATEYLSPFVYGAVDGTITTFAVVASSYGAGLSAKVVMILGFANLFGDGFSMGASSYAAASSEVHAKGGKLKAFWGALATFMAFISIGLIPLLPYVYGLVEESVARHTLFIASMCMTGVSFVLIGYLKGRVTASSRVRAAFETFLLGACAALIAYGVGDVLAGWLTK